MAYYAKLVLGGKSIRVSLLDPNNEGYGKIMVSGETNTDTFMRWLTSGFGSYGHTLGTEAYDYDLHIALLTMEDKGYIEKLQVLGDVPKVPKADIPPDAVT